jgi:nucleotide-binding universal stress UspA family protein
MDNQIIPFVKSVFHPTDFSDESENAFAHALAISVIRKTKLTILHAGGKHLAGNEWTKFPAVRKMLERWHVIPEGSTKEEIKKLGIDVQKVDESDNDPVRASVHYLEENPTDIMVLATRGDRGLPQWIMPSKAEQLAQKTKTMTLFVPRNVKGFVNPSDGEIAIRRILIPVDHAPIATNAIEYATRLAIVMEQLEEGPVEIILLYVGDEHQKPSLTLNEDPRWHFKEEVRKGHVVDEIIKRAHEAEVDLIIMMTEGHHGAFGALRGNTTEQVLRKAPCPLLAVPANDD